MAKRCLIMAGGTGGHVFPGIAVANALSLVEAAIMMWPPQRRRSYCVD